MLYPIVAGALAFNVGSTVLSPVSTRAPLVSMSAELLMAGDFVYGSPAPVSKGLPGFSNPTSFTAGMTGMVVPTASARPATSAVLAGDFVYGSPVPASKGLPGFSNPTCF